MIRIYLTVFLVLFFETVFCQDLKIDSLTNALSKANTSDSLKILIALSKESGNASKPEDCINYSHMGLKLAQKLKDETRTAQCYKWLSYGYGDLKDSVNAVNFALQAIELFENQKNWDEVAKTYNSLLSLYLNYGNIRVALDYGLEALRIRNKHNMPDGILYGNLAILYDLIGYSEKNLEYSLKNLEISKKGNDKIGEAIAYNSIAKAYMDIKNYKSAEEAYENALQIFEELEITIYAASMINNLAGVYYKMGNYKQSLEFYRKSLDMKEKSGLDEKVVFSLKGIGEVYYELKDWGNAKIYFNKGIEKAKEVSDHMLLSDLLSKSGQVYFENNEYLKSKEQFAASNRIASDNGLMAIARINYKYLSKIDSAFGNYEMAYENLYYYNEIKDKLFNEEKSSQLTEMQIRFETQQKDQEIEFLTKKNILQKRIYLVLLALLILLLIAGYSVYTRHRLKTKLRHEMKQLKQEELRATAEINRLNAEKLQEELDHRNRELTASAVFVAERNEILNNIKVQIEGLAKDNKRGQELLKISESIRQNIEKEDGLSKLRYHFESVHPNFFSNLENTYPDMTQNEIKLCAYTKLRLSQKEIAELLNVSLKGIQMARYRLKKKLKLDNEMSLDSFIKGI